MSLLEEKASAAADHMARKSGVPESVALDPLTLLAILDLLVTVVASLVKCYRSNHRAMLRRAKNPSAIDLVRLRRHAQASLGRVAASAYPVEAAEAVLHLGDRLTEAEMASLVREAGGREMEGDGDAR